MAVVHSCFLSFVGMISCPAIVMATFSGVGEEVVGSPNRLAVTDVTPVHNWYLNKRLNHHISMAQDISHQAISSQETQIAINFHGNCIVSCPFEASVYSWGTLQDTGSSMHALENRC